MKKFTSNLKLFLLLAAMVAGVSDAWGGTVTFDGTKGNSMGTSVDGVTFTLASFNHYSKKSWGKTTYYYYYLGSGNNGNISWSVPTGKVIRITGITINAQNQKSFAVFEGTKTGTGYIYSSLLSESNKIQVCNTTSPANYSYTNTGNSNLLGTNGLDNTDRLYFYAKDREFQFQTITITYSIEDLATYYFKSVAEVGEVKGGSVQTTFTEGAYTSSSATTLQKLTTPKAETPSISKDVWYKAAVSGTNKFSGWAETSNGTPISSANPYKTTITATKDNTSEANAATKTLYAIFSSVLKPVINGSDKVDAKVGLSYVADFSFENVANTVPGASSNGSNFYYTISHNVTTSNTNGSADGSKVISYNPTTNTVTPLNEGTATITFTQNGTAEYEYATKSFSITVTKNENPILLSIDGNTATAFDIPFGNKKELTIASDNDATTPAFVVANVSGDAAAYSEERGSHYISAGVNTSDASWTVTQAEDYKYKQGTATFSVHVGAAAEATDCYVKSLETDVIEKKLGNYSDDYKWEDEIAAGVLYFSAKRQGASVGDKIKVEQLVEGSWIVVGGEITGYGTSYTPEQITLNPNAKGIRFCVSGSLNNSITNVRVTRKTYLNAADVTVNKTSGNNLVCPGDQGVGTLVINRSLANGGDLKVTWDNAKFTINGKTSAEGVNLGNFDCTTGVSELPIIFNAAAAGTETAHVVIYNNVYRATATITGETVKRTQNFEWHIENVIPAGFSIAKSEAFTSTRSSSVGVSYSFSPAGIIEIEGENLVAKTAGTVDVTAHVNGGVEYNDVEETKTITVTNDLIQSIAWSQSLMGLHLGDADLTLTASATSEETCSTNGIRPIVYTSADESVVTIVNGNQLHIVGEGKTTVTASQAGGLDADGHTYVAVSAEKKVIVRDPSAVCENYIYEQDAEVRFDLGWNDINHQTKSHEISFNGNEPGYYNFDYKGEPINVLFAYYDGEMIVEQYVNGAWSQVRNLGKPAKSIYKNTGDVALDRRATKMRVIANDGMGYHYFKDCQVSLARYIELLAESNVVSEMNFSTKCGASLDTVVTIHYSNLADNLTFSLPDGCPFSLDKTSVDASCGDKGNVGLKITYTPMAPETDAVYNLTISDGTTTTVVALHASATITDRVLSWEQVPTDVYTVETVNFTAVAQTTLGDAAGTVAYTVTSSDPADMATIAGNTMTFTKAGQVTVEAAAVPDARYTMPAPQTKTWTVVKTPTVVAVSPTITTSPLVAGADVAALTFNPGVAQNTVNAEEVSGTFTITSTGSLVSGANTVWFEFTPDDTDMYLPTTASVEIEVLDAFVFEGNGGTSEEWGSNTNWNTGTTPSATDNVIINSDVTIVGDITVHSLTINEGVHVTIDVNGRLTVGDGNSAERTHYGDLYVHNEGEVVLTSGELKVNDFYLESSLGNRFNSVDAKSGELINGGKLNLNGNAYFDLVLDPSGEISYGLYDFVLPFNVDATNGIYYVDALGAHKMTFNVDYAIGAFSESRRAQGGKAWRTFGGTMEKGKGYTISMDDEHPERNVIRFVMQDGTSINLDNTVAMLSSGTDAECGWNAVGNSALYHATIGLTEVSEVQLYNHASNSYTAFAKDAFTYVVGSAFYVQVPNATTMTLNPGTSGPLQAPQRENLHSIEKMELNIKALDAMVVEDRFFFQANEDATTSYEVGHDLQKMGVPTDAKIAQVWANAYGRKMCAVELPLENNELTIPFEMFAPTAGDYVISIPVMADATVYLLREGELLWDLSESEYVITLPKGITTGYSLGVQYNAPAQPSVPTSFETMSDDEASIVKVIVNGTLYLINKADNTVYDAMGHIVH